MDDCIKPRPGSTVEHCFLSQQGRLKCFLTKTRPYGRQRFDVQCCGARTFLAVDWCFVTCVHGLRAPANFVLTRLTTSCFSFTVRKICNALRRPYKVGRFEIPPVKVYYFSLKMRHLRNISLVSWTLVLFNLGTASVLVAMLTENASLFPVSGSSFCRQIFQDWKLACATNITVTCSQNILGNPCQTHCR